MATKKHTTKSGMARRFIEKGLLVDGYAENMDTIERQLEKVVECTIVPRMEREINLTVKGIIASAAGYFLTARVLEGLVPPEYQEDYQNTLAEVRRKGIEYVKLNTREMEGN